VRFNSILSDEGASDGRSLDRGLLLALFTLMGVGLVQVYSSSFIFAIESRGDGLYFFKRQLAFAAIASLVMFATAYAPWRWIERYGWALWLLAGAAVMATLSPALGIRAGGSARWLRLPGGQVFEASEFLKIALVPLLATFASRRQRSLGRLEWPLRIALVAVPLYLVLRQPDFGTFAICASVIFCVSFAFGLPYRYVAAGLAVALPAFWQLVMNVPYRRARIAAFLDPWSDPSQKGFQVIQSMLSFHSGGLTGAGLGQGQGKLFFLPEAHTDFTLAVLGEEMGFVGFVAVISLYGYIAFRGLRLAARAEDPFAKAMALGLSLVFAFTTFINAGVTLGLLPTKGLTLPFLSYGGSSLVMSCFLFGLLLNVDRRERIFKQAGQRAQRRFRERRLREQ
jgi:cell division protein FtsW